MNQDQRAGVKQIAEDCLRNHTFVDDEYDEEHRRIATQKVADALAKERERAEKAEEALKQRVLCYCGDIEALEAEAKRYRDALEKIANHENTDHMGVGLHYFSLCREIAKDALGKREGSSPPNTRKDKNEASK